MKKMNMSEIDNLKKMTKIRIHSKFYNAKIMERKNATLTLHNSSWRFEESSYEAEVISNTAKKLTVKTDVNQKIVFDKEDFNTDGTMGIDSDHFRIFELI